MRWPFCFVWTQNGNALRVLKMRHRLVQKLIGYDYFLSGSRKIARLCRISRFER